MVLNTDIKKIFSGIRGEIKIDEPMSLHTSLGIGGPAEVFVVPEDIDSLREALRLAELSGVPIFPIGGGTNLLVRDEGVEGAIISLRKIKPLEVIKEDRQTASIKAGAGVALKRLVDFSAERGFSGMEGLSGIPGQIGGAIAGNAGAFGCEIKDALTSVTLMDADGNLSSLSPEELHLGYRESHIPTGSTIVEAVFNLKKDDGASVSERTNNFLKEKKQRQPVGHRSAGCVFKNPKGISAGKLIDEAGLKGVKVGDIEVSGVHANFFINRGKGTATDFLRLMEIVSGEVNKGTGIVLEPEIRIIGIC